MLTAMPENDATYVVVGGGQAAAWIARTLRAEGFAGRLVLIGEEPHWPYERPALSKEFLRGTGSVEAITLLNATLAEEAGIECWLGQRVTAVDREARVVTTADGRSVAYDTLFLATGGQARRLPGLDAVPAERVHTLRTLTESERLRGALAGAKHLLVLGGGWIGLEVAATARALGVAVTVVEAAPRLCARTMPPVVSDWLHTLHEANGVHVLTGTGVAGVTGTADGVAVTLADGGRLDADHLLLGIGIEPEVGLAAAMGLALDDGIVVDAQGRTSDPRIFAAGDVARHPNAFAGAALRLESWANAQNQAIAAARAALGGTGVYADIPWFWSDQYGVNVQMLGLPGLGTRAVARGTPEAGSGCWLMLDESGIAVGAVAVNAARDLRVLRKLLEDGRAPLPDAWADTATPVQRLPSRPNVGMD
ncbi:MULTISPECIES: NAD(P)/FAD-dependent oxidoreductase [Azospirillum]|uniref:Ferredoxin-NAD reductase n=1 Tax=Azospirillum lipoferum TaxID=193 RepID=A0A5A9GNB5_AZOLI|nr:MULTISPECIES: FAD-dependent oxidoreductase [Azospirillum]KAA0595877.1 ferredoxin-NAD reductase [Azospirillum lipoferum]MDW5537262.1 FAD-dependent oxidoreductase [Azospirillum sp. NL1]